jgi:hypothetical protein
VRQNLTEQNREYRWHDLAIEIASAVWHKMKTPNIRQCVKIAKMTKKKEDVDWLIETMKKYQDSGEDWNE